MLLLTAEIKKKLPALYATEAIPLKDKIAVVKLFDPCGAYTFWVVEGSEEEYGEQGETDWILWGYTTLGFGRDSDEFGYSSLNEIKAVKNRFGLGIERDLHWTPCPLKDIPEIFIYETATEDDEA